VKYSYDCSVYTTVAANLPFASTPYVAILPQSPTLCLKLDSTTETDVDVVSANVSGIYIK
jgi:hypothetical protein